MTARFVGDRISSAGPSPIFLNPLKNPIKKYLLTRKNLSQTKRTFPEFSTKNFIPQSLDIYLQAKQAFQQKDRPQLLKHLSMPLYWRVMERMVSQKPVFFIKDVYAASLGAASLVEGEFGRWHQVGIECKTEVGPRLIVLQKKQAEDVANNWRLCYIPE